MLAITILAYLFSAKTTQPLKDACDMQKDLIANASHELKTPLAIISANLAVMNSEKDSSVRDNEKWMESISGQADSTIALKSTMSVFMVVCSSLLNSSIPFTSSFILST